MAYRSFRDSSGTEWEAWDVVPRLVERRLEERRRAARPISFAERRRAIERRVISGRRVALTGLEQGWLCFDAHVEKRRLAPIPADWPHCDDACLEAYCRAARPVRRASSATMGRSVGAVERPGDDHESSAPAD